MRFLSKSLIFSAVFRGSFGIILENRPTLSRPFSAQSSKGISTVSPAL
jgi:hypothetical protein